MKVQQDVLIGQNDLLALPMDTVSHAINKGNTGKTVEMLDARRPLLWSKMRHFRELLLQVPLVVDELGCEVRVKPL